MRMYVIQVTGGNEVHVRDLITRLLGPLVGECFIPQREVFRRVGGEWVTLRERLFPGYLFITTNKIQEVSQRLSRVPAFTRLLGKSDERIIPLTREEVAWLRVLLTPQTKVLETSEGIIEGDRVIVTEGPLKGHEAQIVKIDRHRRFAYLDMRMFGRAKTIKVGLRIVQKNIT